MVRLTMEYCGGLLAGFGVGVLLLLFGIKEGVVAPTWNPLVFIPAFALIAIGASLAKCGQSRPK